MSAHAFTGGEWPKARPASQLPKAIIVVARACWPYPILPATVGLRPEPPFLGQGWGRELGAHSQVHKPNLSQVTTGLPQSPGLSYSSIKWEEQQKRLVGF